MWQESGTGCKFELLTEFGRYEDFAGIEEIFVYGEDLCVVSQIIGELAANFGIIFARADIKII